MSDPTDEVTWLREIEAAMTPEPWVTGAGDIFAATDLHDGMVKDGECEVASCYGRNRQAEEAGITVLRNLAPFMIAVIEAADRTWREMDDLENGEKHAKALSGALDAFRAAVREEQEREWDRGGH